MGVDVKQQARHADIRKRSRSILSAMSGRKQAEIEEMTTLEELGFDSLDRIEAMMMFEEEFRIDIGDKEGKQVETLCDVVALVERKLA